MSEPFIRIESDNDPERCDGLDSLGQCRYKAIRGTTKCPRHAFNKQTEAKKQEVLANYRLRKWNDRVLAFVNSDGLKSLREEIGITRMVMEEIINKCEEPSDVLIYADKIHHCSNNIKDLIVACQKLEERNGLLLDKAAVVSLADQMVKIIGDHIDDPDKLAEIGNLFFEAILKTASASELAHDALKMKV